MAFSQTHFQNSRNFQVHNGQFFNIANPTIINNLSINDPVSSILWPHVASGAIFDSAERYPGGTCHPGTRKRMIERIISWAVDTNTTSFLLWLYGSAGAGKSALAHTICELLNQEHPEIFGATFFFASGPTDRGNSLKLFNTLSYQLAIHFPSIRSQINDALSHDPSLPTKSMEIQFLSLIVQPLLHCESLPSPSPILVIDGLDECADDDAQRNIIALIAKFIVQYNLPLRFMVASRPEYWIRDAFDTAPLPDITQTLCLRDDLDADMDIKAYLIDGFEKILLENKRVMGSVALPWPPAKIIQRFVEEASGQYVYASTILKFVGKSSRFCNPQKQLEIITSPCPNRALAFPEFDRLYTKILSAYPEWETMKRVIEGLLVNANTSIIKSVLGVSSDDLVMVLDALSSLIDIETPRQPPDDYLFLESVFGPLLAGQDNISFCHRSFGEFIEDETRSGAFHIDLDRVQDGIVTAFFDMIHSNFDQKYETEPHLFLNIDRFTYHNIMRNITSNCALNCSIAILLPHISRITQRIESFDLGCISLDSLLYFTQDLERMMGQIFYFEQNEHGRKTAQFELTSACDTLLDTLRLAQKRAMDALSLYTAFKVTPTLVYLADYNSFGRLSVQELSTVPGTIDVVSMLAHHRHFLHLSSFHTYDSWSLESMNLGFFRASIETVEASRIQREWKDERIFLARHHINSILSWRRIMGYRQLPNLQTLKLLQDYDESLEQAMTATMKLIFEQSFLPDFTKSSPKELRVFASTRKRSITLRVLPLPQGFHQEDDSTPVREFRNPENWRTFHDKVFGSGETTPDVKGKGSNVTYNSVIDPMCWHPFLAARLLNYLVTFLYGQIHPTFSTEPYTDYQDFIPYLIQCLPYAEPTLKNLEALRAMVYLYPHLPDTTTAFWNPPEVFWRLVMEFLQKFDHSVLSAGELDLFMLWLRASNRADITTYVSSSRT